MDCYINFQMSKEEGDIDEWLLVPSSNVSDDGGPEGDFDADELAFDRVFGQELETRLASEERLNDIPNIEMLETELSGENYDDNLDVENEEDWDSADDENTNYEVEFPYEQAELQGVDDYRAQGEEPSDSAEEPLGEVIESRETVSPPPTQFFQHGDFLNRTTNHRLKGLTVEEDQEVERGVNKGLWTGEDQGLEEVEVYKKEE